MIKSKIIKAILLKLDSMKKNHRCYICRLDFRWLPKEEYLENEELLVTGGLVDWRYQQNLGEPKERLLTRIKPLGIELLTFLKDRTDYEAMDQKASELGYGFNFQRWMGKIRQNGQVLSP